MYSVGILTELGTSVFECRIEPLAQLDRTPRQSLVLGVAVGISDLGIRQVYRAKDDSVMT
jgi:hypothetical protein